MKVVIAISSGRVNIDPPQTYFKKLKESFPKVSFSIVSDPKIIISEMADAEVLFAPLITPELINAAPLLKWFHSSSIQFGNFVSSEVFKSNILITNSRGAFSNIVAENVIGAALFLAHKMDTFKGIHDLDRKPAAMALMYTKRLKGKHMGIVGLGANGRMVAKYAQNLGITVSGIKRNVDSKIDGKIEILKPDRLPDILKKSDILVITAPSTSETIGMLSEKEIRLLPKEAILINAGKPEIDDDEAVVSALKSGHLFGYACDDIIPEESPIRTAALNSTVIFPHAGPGEKHFWNNIFGIFAGNLKKYLSGEKLANIMNREFKY